MLLLLPHLHTAVRHSCRAYSSCNSRTALIKTTSLITPRLRMPFSLPPSGERTRAHPPPTTVLYPPSPYPPLHQSRCATHLHAHPTPAPRPRQTPARAISLLAVQVLYIAQRVSSSPWRTRIGSAHPMRPAHPFDPRGMSRLIIGVSRPRTGLQVRVCQVYRVDCTARRCISHL
jgi:hypothetical protein